jgi:hypothetical protein
LLQYRSSDADGGIKKNLAREGREGREGRGGEET